MLAKRYRCGGKMPAALASRKALIVHAAQPRILIEKLARRREVDADRAVFVDFPLVAAHAATQTRVLPRAAEPRPQRRNRFHI